MSELSESIWVASGFGATTRQPFVSLKVRDVAVMISPAEARDLAANLMHCAEAAEGDGFIVTWLHEGHGVTDSGVVAMLRDFRAYREAQRREHP